MKATFIHFQIVCIAKSVTGDTDNQTAIMKFREKLNSSESYFNPEPIPKNESDKEAHRNAVTLKELRNIVLNDGLPFSCGLQSQERQVYQIFHVIVVIVVA